MYLPLFLNFYIRYDVILYLLHIFASVISSTLKSLRKEHRMTQVDLAMKSGVGLNFVRQLEQGKTTVRMDKVVQVFDLFGYELVPQKKLK